MDITVRRAEPDDYEGFCRTFTDESAYSGTLQLPMPTREHWRKRLAETAEGHDIFVACAGEEIVGNAGLHPVGPSPRRAVPTCACAASKRRRSSTRSPSTG